AVSTPAVSAELKRKAATHVQNGKIFFEMNRLQEAEMELKQAIKQNPQNEAALYYLNLIREKRPTTRISPLSHPLLTNQPLYFRQIKLDLNTFRQGIKSVTGIDWGIKGQAIKPGGGLGGIMDTNDMSAIRQFLQNMGLDLDPPKSIFYNDREGMLLVRGTLQDLDTIEGAVQVLNIAPPQINIKAKFIEMPKEEARVFWEHLSPAPLLPDSSRR